MIELIAIIMGKVFRSRQKLFPKQKSDIQIYFMNS